MAVAYHSESDLTSFVEQRSPDPIYYGKQWIEAITKLYGYTFIPLTTTNSSGEITGYLPLCYLQSVLTGRRLVSLPFTDFCPPIAEGEASMQDLLDQAVRLAQEKRVRYLELRTGVNPVLAQRTDFVESNLYARWVIPLSKDPDATWSGLRKPVQRQIRKSQNLGVRVRFAQKREEMMQYFEMHLQTRMKHGMPAQPPQFFLGLWDNLASSGKLQLLLAEYEGKVIAGMILIASGTNVTYSYGASRLEYLNLSPNNQLLWESIVWGCNQGYKTLDLGRTARANEGLMEFKRRFGAVEEPLPYYYYPETAGLAATSESSKKFRILTNGWRKLPLQIAQPLGGYLYRHLG